MGKTPKEIRDVSSATAIRGNIIHSSTSTSNNESVGVLSEDISRVQSAIHSYSNLLTYKLNDLVVQGGNFFINILPVTTPENFNPNKWENFLPLTTKGDLLGYTDSDKRIPVGNDNQVLTADSSSMNGVSWKTPIHFTSPLSVKGDLFGFDTQDNKIPVGSDNQVLTADTTANIGISWKTPVHFTSPLSVKGDLFGFDTQDNKIPVGSDGQVLVANSVTGLGLNWINPALEEIGRFEVIANSLTIIVPLSKQKKNLFVKFLIIPTAVMLAQMRFNDDTSATISELMVDDFVSVSSQTGDNDIQISDVGGESNPMAGTIDITNVPTQIKQGMVLKTGTNGTGALSMPTTKTNVFKWINTTVGINEIRFIVTAGAGLYGIGSYVIVYGFD